MLDQVVARRVVPVIVVHDPDRSEGLAEALVAGGLPVAEVTLRTAAAPEVIRRMAANPDLIVGAGTVVTAAQADLAVDAGARFLVSPGLDADVVARAEARGVPIVPGAVTPTEVIQGLKLGLSTLKYFPANTYGGAAALKALAAVFADVRFIPTGGVGLGNLGDYLRLPNVPAVGGSWMVPADAIDRGDFAAVQQLCADAVAAAAAA